MTAKPITIPPDATEPITLTRGQLEEVVRVAVESALAAVARAYAQAGADAAVTDLRARGLLASASRTTEAR